MEQRIVNAGVVNENWKRWLVAWLVLVVVVSIVTPLGFLATLTGTAGLFFVYHGVRAVMRAVSSRSVERTDVGSLDGRREAVQIVGRARPAGEPLTTPLTDTDCSAYMVEVKEFNPSTAEGE